MSLAPDRLEQQLRFIIEMDKLKSVLRQTRLIHEARRENSAEHSWHLAMMALVLAEYAPDGTDALHALQLLLVHDVVEIEAGDTFCYDPDASLSKEERERAAADHLFGLLPPDQAADFRLLWEEFEAGQTAEARFANALDRLQPLLHNFHTEGGTWRLHGIRRAQVEGRMAPIQQGAPALWPHVLHLLQEAVAAGYITTDDHD